jgi:hypothetical protein
VAEEIYSNINTKSRKVRAKNAPPANLLWCMQGTENPGGIYTRILKTRFWFL